MSTLVLRWVRPICRTCPINFGCRTRCSANHGLPTNVRSGSCYLFHALFPPKCTAVRSVTPGLHVIRQISQLAADLRRIAMFQIFARKTFHSRRVHPHRFLTDSSYGNISYVFPMLATLTAETLLSPFSRPQILRTRLKSTLGFNICLFWFNTALRRLPPVSTH